MRENLVLFHFIIVGNQEIMQLIHLLQERSRMDSYGSSAQLFLLLHSSFPHSICAEYCPLYLKVSLLTDFLILFFTEALFYCGVGGCLVLKDYLWRAAAKLISAGKSDGKSRPFMWHRISSIVILLLNLVIPLVTMGFVWLWTGPAASATLAPYLDGIVIQHAFEQYARYARSPSWPVIPIIFQVYRLHQLNRAAQLVTALSFTVRAAETTPHNLAINSSLGTLLNVLQLLGVICIRSLSSFLIRVFPYSAITEQ
ncbi:hypothetical protein AKJ16_DCAP10123 [Drosera capensis]